MTDEATKQQQPTHDRHNTQHKQTMTTPIAIKHARTHSTNDKQQPNHKQYIRNITASKTTTAHHQIHDTRKGNTNNHATTITKQQQNT